MSSLLGRLRCCYGASFDHICGSPEAELLAGVDTISEFQDRLGVCNALEEEVVHGK